MAPSADKAVLQVEQHKYNVAQQGKALAQTIHNFADQLEQLAKEIESTPASAYANGTAVLPNFGLAVNGVLASGSGGVVETKKRKRGEKEKKIKDPNAPKRPPSAYLLYQNQIRHQMKEKYPELPYKEMLGKISDSWAQLGDKEKKQFQDETAQLKTTYETNRAEYERANGIVSLQKGRKSIAAVPAAAAAPTASEDEDDEVDSEEDEPPAPAAKKAVVKEESSTASGTESGSDDDDEEEEEEQQQPKKKQKQVTPPPPPAPVKEKKSKRAGKA